MRPHPWSMGAVAVGILATAAALLGGPKAAELGDEVTGDAALAAAVREAAGDPAGYRGLSVALIDNGTVRFAGIGDSGVAQAPRIGPDTAFEIGSIGKGLTGMLLADMIADGTVRADEPLGELLTEVSFTDERLAGRTLAELASHRSGLPGVATPSIGQALGMQVRAIRGKDPYAGQDRDWLVSSLSGARAPAAEPTSQYSNYGFAALGQALAARAGIPYPELVQQRILDPVGMSGTGYHLDGAALPEHRAAGATGSGRTVDPWQASGYAPAGVGVWSTAEDLATLVSALLAGEAPGADATEPRFADRGDSRIGYGWVTTPVDSKEITWHNGGTGGFRSFAGFDPEAGRGVVVLGNTDRWVDHIGMRLLGADVPEDSGAPGIAPVVVTIVFSLTAGLSMLYTATRPGLSWPWLVTDLVVALGMLAVVYQLGAWLTVPPLVWAVSAGLVATAVAWSARRWRELPVGTGRSGLLRWAGAALMTLAVGAALGWLHA